MAEKDSRETGSLRRPHLAIAGLKMEGPWQNGREPSYGAERVALG